ncbi:ArsR/SmtB family transcription factor [Streptomyces sp. NPDC020917]|uniref:ArsR/SmtB family transcription factor n=1 Tax=Streptomyces sp. NPDC020917 TaxID=3365102 RepID=UPI0037A977CC
MSTPVDERRLDAVFMSLADPTRRGILARLAEGEATVKELAEPYAMSMQAVSQHIRVLEQSGLISRGRYRQTRPCRLEPAVLEAAVSWIEESRRVWAERMDRLEAHLARLQEQDPGQEPDPAQRAGRGRGGAER